MWGRSKQKKRSFKYLYRVLIIDIQYLPNGNRHKLLRWSFEVK